MTGGLTIECSGDPMQDRAPQIYPANKFEIIWRVWLPLYDVKYCGIQDSDRPSDA